MRWMITIRFRPEQRAEIDALVPQEQAHVRALMERGTIETLYLSTDRSQVWLVMRGDSQAQVEQELRSFPLYPYMQLEIASLR